MLIYRLARRTFSSALSSHHDSHYNNANSPFQFTDEHYQKISKQLSKYPPQYKKSAVKSLLYMAQAQCGGWVPLAAMNKIAKILQVSEMEIYQVASFYTMFNREPVGKYHLQVCGTTPCMVRGARSIIQAIENQLGIIKDQSTRDGLFTLTQVQCLGACVNAPMLQINGEQVYEDLTAESVVKILQDLKAGKQVKTGPQVNRNFCEGVQGRTTLKEMPKEIQCRNFDQLKEELKEKEEVKNQ